jgi:hypothetical protein
MNRFVPLLCICLIFFYSCVDENNFTKQSVQLQFSTDTLSFDTIFTGIGSRTLALTVKNEDGRGVIVSNVKTANDNSYFNLNIDGVATNWNKNVEIAPRDSIYIFVQANPERQNEDLPVFIRDSILFEMDGLTQDVKLMAYGQDVNVVKSRVVTETMIWDSPKPYWVMDSVFIAPNASLRIRAGTVVYFHKDAKIEVFGSIEVDGTIQEPVVLRGDRLDEVWDGYEYDFAPGQWGGVRIYPSGQQSAFNNCIIRNATNALVTGVLDVEEDCSVMLHNTVIHNSSIAGLYAMNSDIKLTNCQITNSGYYNAYLVAGGSYNFYHCTIANYYGLDYNASREDIPCLIVSNALVDGSLVYFNPLNSANFYNCIVDGNLDNEMAFIKKEDVGYNVEFNNCVIKTNKNIVDDFPSSFNDCLFNDTVKYRSVKRWDYNFAPDSGSVVINRGNIDFINSDKLQFDIRGNSRMQDERPDIGAYEWLGEVEI